MKKLLILIACVLGMISCTKKEGPKEIPVLNYECPEIGWTFTYPSDWHVMTADEIAKLENKGKEIVENAVGQNVPLKRKNLLWLKKDAFNSFTSVLEPYDSKTDGPYTEIAASLKQVLINSYKSQGIIFDYKDGSEMIGGKQFSKIEINLYKSKKELKEQIMSQVIYDALITDNYSLTLSLNYNDEKNKEEIMKIIKTSKFGK